MEETTVSCTSGADEARLVVRTHFKLSTTSLSLPLFCPAWLQAKLGTRRRAGFELMDLRSGMRDVGLGAWIARAREHEPARLARGRARRVTPRLMGNPVIYSRFGPVPDVLTIAALARVTRSRARVRAISRIRDRNEAMS